MAQTFTVVGLLFGIFPGLIIAALTTHSRRITCPMCERHVGHWSRSAWFAGTGWLIVILFAAMGAGVGYLFKLNSGSDTGGVGGVIGTLIGLACYLIPLIRLITTRVKSTRITEQQVEFSNVSSVFANAARQQAAMDEEQSSRL